ncbi:hypothetical protein BC830DRAFT_1171562 [Chytriomyces sp. MP71]|nr:hypothetical protein BC830DRAFT_1171562 [Chytriomyces sp. MP71]
MKGVFVFWTLTRLISPAKREEKKAEDKAVAETETMDDTDTATLQKDMVRKKVEKVVDDEPGKTERETRKVSKSKEPEGGRDKHAAAVDEMNEDDGTKARKGKKSRRETKNEGNELALNEKLTAFGTQVLHEDVQQKTRETAIQGFREGKFEVDLVINCEPPSDVETYVHRSRRTGRAGKSGICEPKNITKSRSLDSLDALKQVHPEALSYCSDTPEALLVHHGNDPLQTLSASLAVICNTTKRLPPRSLPSATEGFFTVLFQCDRKSVIQALSRRLCKGITQSRKHEDAPLWRLTKDETGVVADVNAEKIEVLEGGQDTRQQAAKDSVYVLEAILVVAVAGEVARGSCRGGYGGGRGGTSGGRFGNRGGRGGRPAR